MSRKTCCALTGAEAATVVNNNAAAVLLALNTLAEGREVIVSRGELIEIGGSFRIPDVMAKSGARLREVGTTNRTHLARLRRRHRPSRPRCCSRCTPATTASSASPAPCRWRSWCSSGASAACRSWKISAAARWWTCRRYGLPKEPVVAERVRAGADVVTFSGDKLLGGPQAGIIVGRRELIERIKRNPLKRALRCDKLTLAALEATLRLYRTRAGSGARRCRRCAG